MARTCVLIAAVLLVGATVAHADPPWLHADRDLVRAHHERVAGAALIAVGTALAAAPNARARRSLLRRNWARKVRR